MRLELISALCPFHPIPHSREVDADLPDLFVLAQNGEVVGRKAV